MREYRIVIKTTIRNLKTGLVYVAKREKILGFPPFTGLILCFNGDYKLAIKPTSALEYDVDGGDFFTLVPRQTVCKDAEEEAKAIKKFTTAGFRVWWPYDREEHLKRKKKPTLSLVSIRDES